MATLASEPNVKCLQSCLEVDDRDVLVTLTNEHLSLDPNSHNKSRKGPSGDSTFKVCQQIIDVRDIIAAQPEKCVPQESKCAHIGGHQEICTCVEMVPLNPLSFSVHYAARQTKHKWRVKKIIFLCPETKMCQQWIETLQLVIQSKDLGRPKSLLVFVNPFGGKKKGPKIFREKVAPLFKLAGISTNVKITERAGQAKEHIQQCDLTRYDGLVCVGGDGMFSEFLNGLLEHTQHDHCIEHTIHHHPVRPQLKIGIIPAGSTNTVVYSTTGTSDPVTSAIHIILGDSVGIDVTGVFHQEQFVTYNVSMLGYGFYGDVLVDSETHRWMGPKRYDWCGFKKVLSNRGYAGEITFLPSEISDSTPQDGTRCLAGCNICKEAMGRIEGSSDKVSDQTASQGWKTISGRFVGINSFVMSCRCGLSPEGAAPTCHLGDGCADLAIIKHGSRIDYMRHLYRCTAKKADQFDFPFVQVYRVREFKFRALGEESDDTDSRLTSVWNCDGELVRFPNISVKIYCQLVTLFARGLEDGVRRSDTTEITGCGQCM